MILQTSMALSNDKGNNKRVYHYESLVIREAIEWSYYLKRFSDDQALSEVTKTCRMKSRLVIEIVWFSMRSKAR